MLRSGPGSISEIGRFTRTARIVGRTSDAHRDVVLYADPLMDALRLRIETRKEGSIPSWRWCEAAMRPDYRWFYVRAGHKKPLALYVHDDTPKAARKEVQRLSAGDESAILGVYLLNGSPGRCQYHDGHDLLQEFTVVELQNLIVRNKKWLGKCAREGRKMIDVTWPLRREVRELEKTLRRYLGWVKRNGFSIRAQAEAQRAA